MKNAWSWIKGNPITVASIMVVLLSLGFLGWVTMRGSALEEDMSKTEGMVRTIGGLLSRTVQVPPEQPDAPPESLNITINPVAIDQLRKLHGRIGEEYEEIFGLAVQVNQGGHGLLVDGMLPEPKTFETPFQARTAYLEAFETMLEGYPEGAGAEAVLPRLDAGMPPTPEEISGAVARLEQDFQAAMKGAQMTPEDQQTLFREKRARAVQVLLERAQDIHLYAATDLRDPAFPFQILPWALTQNRELAQDRPLDHQLFEGQLELWIQEDIVRAIAATNRTGDESTNVIDAPIKRLLKIEVIPGYVGLHTLGGLHTQQQRVQVRADGAYPAPLGGQTGDANARVSDNFYVGPTGRVSNALYDVRHARLEIVADYARLPQFFNNLTRSNFMTVLQVKLEDVDEYDALQEGFVYGPDDAVRAEIIIETIWLRQWTEQLMPKLTRQYVGIDPATDLETQQPGMMGPEYYMEDFGPYGNPYGNPYGAPPAP